MSQHDAFVHGREAFQQRRDGNENETKSFPFAKKMENSFVERTRKDGRDTTED